MAMADLQARDESAMAVGRARPTMPATRSAGPFGVATPPNASSTTRDTLITGLLVIYPAVATVAAIIVWLALTRSA